MKPCFLLLALLGWASFSFCQTRDSLDTASDSYLRKSNAQITTGIIMAGAGTGLVVYDAVAGAKTVLSFLKLKPTSPGKNYEAIGIAGDVLFAGGTALLVIGEVNRSKAMHLKFGMQKTEALLPASRIGSSFQPALTLTISLSKRKQTS